MRVRDDWSRDEGSGSLLAIGIMASVAAALALGLPLYLGLGLHESVAIAADASALAAADVAAGVSPGSPCMVAGEVASANHVALDACEVDGLVVTVRASARFLGLEVAATATAGPPVVVTN